MVQPIQDRFRQEVNRHIREEWCGPLVATRGLLHDTSDADGFIAVEGDVLLGYVLYAVENGQCESWCCTACRKIAALARP